MPRIKKSGISDHLTQATLCYNAKDYVGAQDLTLALIAEAPNEAELYLLLAKCQTRADALDDALESINRCIALGVEDAEVVNQKGVIYLLQNKTVLAEKYLLVAAEMDPTLLAAMINLMALYEQIRNSHELNRWGNKVLTFTVDQIRRNHSNPDIGELYDAYYARAMARWHMEVPDAVVLTDIQKAIGYYKQLPAMDQDAVDLDWLLVQEQKLIQYQP